jgi:signal transduction histidine kinase
MIPGDGNPIMGDDPTILSNAKLIKLLLLGRKLNAAIEMEPFLQILVESICELTSSETSSLFLFEAETSMLKFVAAPRSSSVKLKRLRVPLEHSVAGEAYTTGKPVIIRDAQLDARIYRSVDEELSFTTHSILAVPVTYRQETLGVLEAVNKFGNAQFDDSDLIVLETIASYAGTYLFNAILFEEALQATQALEEMEKKKNDFLAIASHELRTPLGLIVGHASYLRETKELSEQSRSQLDTILRSTMRMRELIEEMSNTHLGAIPHNRLKRKSFSINRMVEEVVASFSAQANRQKIQMRVDLPAENLMIQGDNEKMAIAFGNIVKNSLTYTEVGGHVLVKVEKLPGFAKVSVIDDGIGIPAVDLPHIFDKFYQVESHLNRRHGGIGLGLSVAKVMVEMHGGQIWAESIEGKGSNFSFLIPVALDQGGKSSMIFAT